MSPAQGERAEIAEMVRSAVGIAARIAGLRGQRHREHDLTGAALHALHEALGRYDRTCGVPFKAFARARIAGAVADAVRGETRRSAHERALEDALRDGPEDSGVPARAVASFVLHCASVEVQAGGAAGLLRPYRELQDALARLPPVAARLLALRYREGLRPKEVAAALGLSERTVRDHDARLRAQLEAALLARKG